MQLAAATMRFDDAKKPPPSRMLYNSTTGSRGTNPVVALDENFVIPRVSKPPQQPSNVQPSSKLASPHCKRNRPDQVLSKSHIAPQNKPLRPVIIPRTVPQKIQPRPLQVKERVIVPGCRSIIDHNNVYRPVTSRIAVSGPTNVMASRPKPKQMSGNPTIASRLKAGIPQQQQQPLPRNGLGRMVAQPPPRPSLLNPVRNARPDPRQNNNQPPGRLRPPSSGSGMPGVVYRPRTYGPQRPGMPSRRLLHPHAYDPYGLDVATKEDLEFLDDDVDDDANWRNELRNVTKYDPSAFADEDGEALESNLSKMRAEEALSEFIAKKEDQEELAKLIAAREDEEDEEDEED